jgi:cysteine sulfinate desulfinase/cysteine desulfurase-like protein
MYTKQYFLDANAHVPMSKASLDAFVSVHASFSGHGHPMSPNAAGRAAENAIEESRYKIANLLGISDSSKIIFTSTCTQACEWVMDIYQNASIDKIVHFSPFEHPAIKYNINKFPQAKLLAQTDGVVETNVELNDLAICIKLQNEIGTIQPIEDFNCHVVSDMSQALGKIPISLKNIEAAIFGAHKFGGPTGVGFFYLKHRELWKGFGTGSRYFFDRPGTPDVASIVATAAALEDSLSTMYERYQKCVEFKKELEPKLKELGFYIFAEESNRYPGTCFVQVPISGMSSSILHELSSYGIHIGLGSACGSMYAGGASIVKALGKDSSGNDYLRISNYGFYDGKDAKYVIDKIALVIKGMS